MPDETIQEQPTEELTTPSEGAAPEPAELPPPEPSTPSPSEG